MVPDRLIVDAARLRGRSVLITGAAGFIGSNLMRLLVAAGCRPHGIIRPGSRPWRLEGVARQVVLHEADLADESALEAVFARALPDLVFHLATPRGSSESARAEMLRVNVLGAVCLSRLVAKYRVRRLIVAGSSLEYAPSSTALSESSTVAPLSWHGTVKAAASMMFRYAVQATDLPAVLLRLFHVYGPWESGHRLAPTAIRCALEGSELHLTEPGIRRDWVFVDDVCEAMLLAVDRGENGAIFNIGTGVETANEELVACVASATARRIRLAAPRYERRISDAAHRFADISLARDVLGWLPRHGLEAGIRRTIAWHLANPDAWLCAADVRPEVV